MSTKGSSKSPNKSAASDEGSKKKSSKSSDDKSDKKSSSSNSSSSSASESSEDSKYSHPPFKTLVSEAIFEDNAKSGTSKQSIVKFICSNYNVDEEKCPKNVTKTVKKMEKNKELIRQPNSRKYKFHDKWKATYCKETGRKAPKKKRKAPPKDPRMPKRPKTAWNFFSSKVRADLKKKYPSLDFGDISTKLSKRWSDCEDKTEWEALAAKDKKRFQKELKAYEKMIKDEKKKKDSSSDSSDSDSSSEKRKRKEKEKEKKKRKEKERKEKERKEKKMDTSDDEDDKGKGKEVDKDKDKEKGKGKEADKDKGKETKDNEKENKDKPKK